MAKARRVFISYTAEDLVAHADAVIRAVRKLEWIAIEHRDWASSGLPSVAWCLEKVRSCDIVVVIVAHRYGWVPTRKQDGDAKRSIVWIEIDEAIANDLRVLPFVIDPKAPWPSDKIEALDKPETLKRLRRFKAQIDETIRGRFGPDLAAFELDAYRALSESGKMLDEPDAAETPVRRLRAHDPVRRYCVWVEERHRNVELLGFGDLADFKFPIEHAYVPLQVSVTQAMTEQYRGVFDKKRIERSEFRKQDVPVEEAFREAIKLRLRGVALLGNPGAGKTTAALRLAWQCADALHGPKTLGLPADTVPVVLRLRRLQPEDRDLRGFFVRELLTHFHADAALGERLWKRGGLLWLLDGLDEIADADRRGVVSEWIRAALDDRTQDHFLVTCRYAGYQGDAVLGRSFLPIEVQPLTDVQQNAFVERWFRTVENHFRGVTTEAAEVAGLRIADLTAILRSREFTIAARVAEMVANPLLLAIVCYVYRKRLDLPRGRAQLYAECVEVLLEHRRKARYGEQRPALFDAGAARSALQGVAWWMHGEDKRSDAAATDCAERVEDSLRSLSPQAGLGTDGTKFLCRVRDESGLLVSPDPGRFAFLHLSFQEYLAARHAVEQGLATELASRFGQSWWKEAGLLALSQAPVPFATTYFETLLAPGVMERDVEFAALAIQESLHVPIAPFVAALRRPDAPTARFALLLRLLSDRRDNAFLAVTGALADHEDPAIAGAATEVLERAGVVTALKRPPAGAKVIDVRSRVALVVIPAGEFEMGTPEGDPQAYEDERPVHRVRVESFQLAKHPVTNEQFGVFLEKNPNHPAPAYWTNSQYNQPRQPVVGLSWDDAQAYCKWFGLRLPTEAEWEYACRAGTTTRYWSGDDEKNLAEVGWYDGNSEYRLHAVGEMPANPFGLHDMHGNVFEWCEDKRHDNYERTPEDEKTSPDGTSGDRVVRGGSCWVTARYARSACRFWDSAGVRDHDVGFRPARSVRS